MFIETLGTEDARLPRMAMGLGIVTPGTTRFYPMDLIEESGALIDDVDGRQLVFVDSKTFTPAAVFVDASSATSRIGRSSSITETRCGWGWSTTLTARG